MPHPSRRTFLLGLAALSAGTLVSREARAAAESVSVPERLQAKLLAKVAAFDRNMPTRAGALVNILVVQASGDAESERAAARLKLHLNQLGSVAGLPAAVTVRNYDSAAALAAQCRDEGFSIVYLTPGLQKSLKSIAKALEGVSVLTVSAVADHVYDGSVLSFGLEEGKPRILVHLARARGQSVDFKASFLRLAQVVDS